MKWFIMKWEMISFQPLAERKRSTGLRKRKIELINSINPGRDDLYKKYFD